MQQKNNDVESMGDRLLDDGTETFREGFQQSNQRSGFYGSIASREPADMHISEERDPIQNARAATG